MGTSSSHSGPNDKTPLLPAWAQGAAQAAGAGQSPQLGSEPLDGPPKAESNVSDGNELPGADAAAQAPVAAAPTLQLTSRGPWTLARRAMSSAVKRGGGKRRLTVAARRYVSAKGGARKSATSSTAGRAATARLGAFLADIASRGVTEATRTLGLAATVGQKVNVVLAAVIDALAPPGTTDENAVARRATSETLRELFEKYGVEATSLDALNAMTPDGVADAIQLYVSAYVYQRWLLDLSQKIEEHAISETAAVRLERDVKAFVKGLVKLKLNGSQVIQLDWKSKEGKQFVQQIYEAAYKLLGGLE